MFFPVKQKFCVGTFSSRNCVCLDQWSRCHWLDEEDHYLSKILKNDQCCQLLFGHEISIQSWQHWKYKVLRKVAQSFMSINLSNPAELVFNKLSFKDVYKYKYVLYFVVYSALNLNSPWFEKKKLFWSQNFLTRKLETSGVVVTVLKFQYFFWYSNFTWN